VTAYGSGGMLAWLMQHEIEPRIPVLDRSAQTNGVFSRNDFTFDRDHNAFFCPGGKPLRLAHKRQRHVDLSGAKPRLHGLRAQSAMHDRFHALILRQPS
jgi:hypothetical protein